MTVDVLHITPHSFSDKRVFHDDFAYLDHPTYGGPRYARRELRPVLAQSLPNDSFLHACGHRVPEVAPIGCEIFEDLPSVYAGSVHSLLMNGIARSNKATAAHEPDAEKAFFVADLSAVYAQFKRWNIELAGVVPFFAVKSNPDPYVLRLLEQLGAGFDCASRGEIDQVLEIGSIDPARIIFANPCKAQSFIRHAAQSGVHAMTFDNADELDKISRVHPGAKLIVRILTDDSKSVCRLGLKFGAPLDSVPRLLARARELKLNVIGVSFHVGSGGCDPNSFADAVHRARLAFDMGKDLGYEFTLLDIGGGFEDHSFESVAAILRSALAKHFGDAIRHGLKVIAEPGRFFVSKAFSLAANVIARRTGAMESKDREMDSQISGSERGDPAQMMYYINEGVYGAFNCILFDHQKVVPYALTLCRTPAQAMREGGKEIQTQHRDDRQACSVWGPTCDSMDLVCPNTFLPSTLEVGDWLGFANMGAYTSCAASRFNGFERSEVTYTVGVGELGQELLGMLRSSAEGRRVHDGSWMDMDEGA